MPSNFPPSPLDEMGAKGLLEPVDPKWLARFEERHRTVLIPKFREQQIAQAEAQREMRTIRLF